MAQEGLTKETSKLLNRYVTRCFGLFWVHFGVVMVLDVTNPPFLGNY